MIQALTIRPIITIIRHQCQEIAFLTRKKVQLLVNKTKKTLFNLI